MPYQANRLHTWARRRREAVRPTLVLAEPSKKCEGVKRLLSPLRAFGTMDNRMCGRVGAILALAVISAGSVACDSPSAPGLQTETRDSAGITIVENFGELGSEVAAWTVGPDPLLSIGSFEGDSLYQLFQVRGAARLDDGRLVVVNAGSGEVRIYDQDGQYLLSHGRKGEGPGEFESPALAGVLGPDTLVIIDTQLRRISLVQAGVGFLRSARLEDEIGGGAYPQGIFADRTVLLGGGFYWSSDSGAELTDGYTRQATSYQSSTLEGGLATDFGAFPGSEFFMKVRQSGGAVSMSARLIPFGKHAMATAAPDRMYFGSGDSWEIQGYGLDGRLNRLIRLDRELLPVTGDLMAAHLRAEEAEAVDEAQAREIRQGIEEMPIPDFLPAFASLHSDKVDHLWVERSRGPEDSPPTFDIFNPEGTLVGLASLPADLSVLEIGDDYLLGLFRDELEVEYLRLYPLRRH